MQRQGKGWEEAERETLGLDRVQGQPRLWGPAPGVSSGVWKGHSSDLSKVSGRLGCKEATDRLPSGSALPFVKCMLTFVKEAAGLPVSLAGLGV